MSTNRSNNRAVLGIAAAAMLGVAALLQTRIDPFLDDPAIRPKGVQKAALPNKALGDAALPFEYTLGAISGFRQIIAGLLWVRADSFFHSGNYDAILPVIRLITWLDPNWLDPYATGAWHLTYNFTDTDQRSDRRYLPAGVALLNEGIANNAEVYDMYKEKGWLYYDKIKNYERSAKAYADGLKTKNADITQVAHALAHAYERMGQLEKAEEVWKFAVEQHQKLKDDPNSPAELKARAEGGLKNATKKLQDLEVRRIARQRDTKVPHEVDFQYRIRRVKPKVLEVAGTWNLVGAKSFDYENKTIAVEGPVDGARVQVRLFNEGYKMPTEEEVPEFTFEVDPNLTLMQDILSTRGGKEVDRGELFLKQESLVAVLDQPAEKAGIYGFKESESKGLGVPLDQALRSNVYLSPFGKQQLANIAEPLPFNSIQPIRTPQEADAIVAKLRNDPAKIQELAKKGYYVATKAMALPGEFKREIDLTKDPKMYSFNADKYELELLIDPRHTPDFVRDRIGWKGEGWTDKQFLQTAEDGTRLIRVVIPLSREDIMGEGSKVVASSKANFKLPSEIYKTNLKAGAAQVPAGSGEATAPVGVDQQ
ncbi:MAG: hypothetical protein OHK0029_25400 [Armatimonadaceae bacterium]